MKKTYMKPDVQVVNVNIEHQLLAGSGDQIIVTEPQEPGNAMSREFEFLDVLDEDF